jgi:hypothetical protein
MTETKVYPKVEDSYGFRASARAVKDAVPIQDVARRYTELTSLGGNARAKGRCPLPDHADSEPSFYLFPESRYWCFGCSRGGDTIDLEFHCGDYGELWEAMISLAAEYNVELPKRPKSWHDWNQTKYRKGGLHDQLTEVRANVRRRRWFRIFIEPELSAIENADERSVEAERAWSELQGVKL